MERACDQCGARYQAKRRESRYCSAVCRKRMHRRSKSGQESGQERPRSLLVEQTIAELDAAGRLGSVHGVQAVLLASRMEGSMETGAAVAALSKEFSRVMTEALRSAGAGRSRTDELRARRDRRRAG